MNITSSELKSSHSKKRRLAKDLRYRTERTAKTLMILGAAVIIGIIVFFFNIIAGLLIILPFGALFVILFISRKDFIRNRKLKIFHCAPDAKIESFIKSVQDGLPRGDTLNEGNILLGREEDIYSTGYLRYILIRTYLLNGEYENAFRTNYSDKFLFSLDPWYELVYYEALMEYHLNVSSTTGGSEYGEDAYRQFKLKYQSIPEKKRDFYIIREAVFCEMAYAMAHREYNRAEEYLDMLLSVAENQAEKNAITAYQGDLRK